MKGRTLALKSAMTAAGADEEGSEKEKEQQNDPEPISGSKEGEKEEEENKDAGDSSSEADSKEESEVSEPSSEEDSEEEKEQQSDPAPGRPNLDEEDARNQALDRLNEVFGKAIGPHAKRADQMLEFYFPLQGLSQRCFEG